MLQQRLKHLECARPFAWESTFFSEAERQTSHWDEWTSVPSTQTSHCDEWTSVPSPKNTHEPTASVLSIGQMFTKESLLFQQNIKDEHEFFHLGTGKGYPREENNMLQEVRKPTYWRPCLKGKRRKERKHGFGLQAAQGNGFS